MAVTTLHVGLMKSGTTFLQEILNQNRKELLASGWLYPGPRMNQQHAWYGICGKDIYWSSDDNPYGELGKKLIRANASYEGNLLISSEALSSLDENGMIRFVEKLGTPHRIVFTVRSLEKLVPSAWQQSIKSGATEGYGEFLSNLAKDRAELSGLWRTYSYGSAIERWSSIAEVHVVVVPGSSDDPHALWRRFMGAAGIPDVSNKAVDASSSNVSLDVESATILAKINEIAISKGMSRSSAHALRTFYLEQIVFPLAGKRIGTKITLPDEYRELVTEWNLEELSKVTKFGVVHGDTGELNVEDGKGVSTDVNYPAVVGEQIIKAHSALLRSVK